MSAAAARKGGARLEDSATGKASRKSTRKSTGKLKPGTSLELREKGRITSPAARAARSGAAKKPPGRAPAR